MSELHKEQNLANKTLLLVAPLAFYSFAGAMKAALETLDYEVTLANDEYPDNIVGKILGKLLFYNILSRLTRSIFRERFLKGRTYDVCLVVKGRGLCESLIVDLKIAAKRIVGYNFDSFAYNKAPLAWYNLAHKYATFDIVDAKEHAIPRVDLFSLIEPNNKSSKKTISYSAILKNHSERLSYIDAVFRRVDSSNLFIYIYELNFVTFALNFVSSPWLYFKYWRYIHFKPLHYEEYKRVLQESVFTVDFAHPKQSGITMRCFEASASCTKIITNNWHVLEHPFFDETNVIVFDMKDDSLGLRSKVAKMEPGLPNARHRSIREFLLDLLAE